MDNEEMLVIIKDMFEKNASEFDDKFVKMVKQSDEKFEKMVKSFDDKFVDMEERFDQKFMKMEKRFDDKFVKMEKRFDDKFEIIEKRFDQKFDEVKQHTGVLVENLKGDIKAISEGYVDLNRKIDALDKKVDQKTNALQADIKTVANYVSAVDTKLKEHEVILKRVK